MWLGSCAKSSCSCSGSGSSSGGAGADGGVVYAVDAVAGLAAVALL